MKTAFVRKNNVGASSATINWAEPSTQGLGFFAWFGNGGPAIDLVNGLGPTTVSGVSGIGFHKGIFNATSTSTNWQEWSGSWITSRFASKTQLTMMASFTQLTTTANIQGSLMSLCDANGAGYNILGNNGGTVGFWINGGSATSYTGVTTYPASFTHTLCFAGGADATRGLAFQNGAIRANVTAAAISTSANLSRIRVGQERGTSAGGAPNGGGFACIGELNFAAIWTRRLSVSELTQLANDPYKLVTMSTTSNSSLQQSLFRGWGIPV